jgi:hypothetical protein
MTDVPNAIIVQSLADEIRSECETRGAVAANQILRRLAQAYGEQLVIETRRMLYRKRGFGLPLDNDLRQKIKRKTKASHLEVK